MEVVVNKRLALKVIRSDPNQTIAYLVIIKRYESNISWLVQEKRRFYAQLNETISSVLIGFKSGFCEPITFLVSCFSSKKPLLILKPFIFWYIYFRLLAGADLARDLTMARSAMGDLWGPRPWLRLLRRKRPIPEIRLPSSTWVPQSGGKQSRRYKRDVWIIESCSESLSFWYGLIISPEMACF